MAGTARELRYSFGKKEVEAHDRFKVIEDKLDQLERLVRLLLDRPPTPLPRIPPYEPWKPDGPYRPYPLPYPYRSGITYQCKECDSTGPCIHQVTYNADS